MTTVPAVSGTPPAQPSMPKRQPEPLTLGARPAGNEVMVKVFVVVRSWHCSVRCRSPGGGG
jgi:hypothetical protein